MNLTPCDRLLTPFHIRARALEHLREYFGLGLELVLLGRVPIFPVKR
jgi:VanZ family protein